MKRYSNKSFLYILGCAVGFFQACESGDNVIDTVFEDVERGAILRTIQVISDEIPIGQDDSYFGVELEVQDQQDGRLVESVEVYIGFRDNTNDDGEDRDKQQVLAETVEASSFTIGEFGLPRFTYEVTLPEMQTVLGLEDSDVDGGDQFEVRFELVLTDGRRYSFADNSGTLTGSFFSSPFLYVPTVVCPPRAPTPGQWTIQMLDSYGDGWQTSNGSGGPGLSVTLNTGEVFEVGLCSPYEVPTYACTDQASSGTATITIPEGTESAEWFFPGDFYGEIGFTIISPNGNVVADIAPGSGSEGPVAINFCVD